MTRSFAIPAAAILAVLLSAPCMAHDSPEHVVEDLTRLMARRGPTPQLLYRRACEYRALNRWKKAAEDLHAALALDPNHLAACLELGRVQLAQGQSREALKTGRHAEKLARSDADRARVQMLRCRIDEAAGEIEGALAYCEDVCRLLPGDVEWLLQRSQFQADLGRHAERLAGLEAACRENPSVVLKIELIDAQIEGGDAALALAVVERELADSRWQSSWLIRRARVYQRMGKEAAARDDLVAAIAEITERLNPARPDTSLLIDRGTALALSGNRPAAEADLKTARRLKADPWAISRLEKRLARQTPPEPKENEQQDAAAETGR